MTTALRSKGWRASLRSLYHWRRRYLRFGFAGIVRRLRNDRDCPRFGNELPIRIVEAALRVKGRGDMAREFRKLRANISEGTFRAWVRRTQRELRVTVIPGRNSFDGLLF